MHFFFHVPELFIRNLVFSIRSIQRSLCCPDFLNAKKKLFRNCGTINLSNFEWKKKKIISCFFDRSIRGRFFSKLTLEKKKEKKIYCHELIKSKRENQLQTLYSIRLFSAMKDLSSKATKEKTEAGVCKNESFIECPSYSAFDVVNATLNDVCEESRRGVSPDFVYASAF